MLKTDTFEPIPSLNNQYEINSCGVVRNAMTKHILQTNVNVKIDGRCVSRSTNQLLWEVHGTRRKDAYQKNIPVSCQKDEKKYYISSRKSFPTKKQYSDYVPYDEYKERPYKEKYRDDYRNNYNYKERERYSPYYNKYDRYEKYDSKYERRSRSRHSSKRNNSHSKRKFSRNSHSRSRRSRSREYHESRSNHNYNHNIYNKNYSRDKEPIYNNKTKKRDYKEERRRLRERSRSNSVLRMMKVSKKYLIYN